MRHTKHHRLSVSVREAQQLTADALISSGLLPHRSGHYDREHYLLSVDSVHLLTDDLLYLSGHPLKRHVAGIDTVCHILHVAATYHKCMAVDVTVRGALLKAFSYKLIKFHICPFLSK